MGSRSVAAFGISDDPVYGSYYVSGCVLLCMEVRPCMNLRIWWALMVGCTTFLRYWSVGPQADCLVPVMLPYNHGKKGNIGILRQYETRLHCGGHSSIFREKLVFRVRNLAKNHLIHFWDPQLVRTCG